MNEKKLYSYDKGNNKILCNLGAVCDFNVSNVFQLLNSLSEENELLKQSNDRFVDTVAKQASLLIELRKENDWLKQKLEYLNLNEKNDMVKMIDGKAFIRL